MVKIQQYRKKNKEEKLMNQKLNKDDYPIPDFLSKEYYKLMSKKKRVIRNSIAFIVTIVSVVITVLMLVKRRKKN